MRDLAYDSKGRRLGISPLDRLLDVFVYPPRGGVNRNAGESPPRQTQYVLTAARRRKRGSAIEISGATPCSGKTQLLYHIAANALLPKADKDTVLDDTEDAVVWIDTDGRFSIQRLHEILSKQLAQRLACEDLSRLTAQMTSLANQASAALQHLHIFRPSSTPSFISTLNSLPSYLLNSTLHHSASRLLGLIVISNLSAFLGQDHMDSESETTAAGASAQLGDSTFIQRYIHLVSSLRSLQSAFGCTIIAGNWGLSPLQHSANGPSLRPHLPAVWNNFCGLKLITEKARVRQFGPGMSAEEAMEEENQRQEAVEKSGFLCWVNHWGSEHWDDGVSERLGALKNNGGFSFQISQSGIIADDVEEV